MNVRKRARITVLSPSTLRSSAPAPPALSRAIAHLPAASRNARLLGPRLARSAQARPGLPQASGRATRPRVGRALGSRAREARCAAGVAVGVGAHCDRHTLEQFSEDDQSQLDKGKDPDPEHVGQRELYHYTRSWTYPGVSFHFALLPVRVAPRQSTLRSPHRRCAAPWAAMHRSRRPTRSRPSYPSRVGGPTTLPAVPAAPGSSKLQLLAGAPVAFRAPKCGTLQAEEDDPAECPVWLP